MSDVYIRIRNGNKKLNKILNVVGKTKNSSDIV